VFKTRGNGNNPYNVHYMGPRGSYVGKSVQELVCGLKKKVGSIRTVSALDEPFTAQGLRELFPKTPIFTEKYNTCAIVTNAGSLSGSRLGTFIGELCSILQSTMYISSSSDNFIPGGAGVKRQAGQVGSTAHTAPTFFCLFQKHCLITCMTAVSIKQRSKVECQTFLTK
jgi:hypothetical protein